MKIGRIGKKDYIKAVHISRRNDKNGHFRSKIHQSIKEYKRVKINPKDIDRFIEL